MPYNPTDAVADILAGFDARIAAAESGTAPTLGMLTLSGSLQIGTATSGTIIGATAGSTIAGNIPGITVDSGARTYSGTPTGSAGSIANGLVETLAGAIGSPLSSPVAVAAASVTPVPTMVMSASVSQAEGNSGTAAVVVTVTVTRNGAVGALTVNLSYTGTATSGTDYATPPSSVTIGSGVSATTFSVIVNGDTDPETDETIIINAALAGYSATASRTITITNDDVGVAPTANETLLAAVPKDGTAIGSVLAGSRGRQNNQGTAGEIRAVTSGPITFAQAMARQFRITAYTSSAADTTSTLIGGLFFANDGEGSTAAYQRVPAIIASDAQFCIVELSSNSLQLNNFDIYGRDLGTTMTAAGYIANYVTIVEALIAGGVAVIVNDLWERDTLAGGIWASGSRRTLVPAINDLGRTEFAARGIPFVELRPILIDSGSADSNPRTEVVRSDGTHFSEIGAYEAALEYISVFTDLGFASRPYDVAAAGNLATNPTLAGPSGAPTGYTLNRTGALATVTPTTITKDGKQWLEYALVSSGLGATQEGVSVTAPAPTLEVGKWYQGSVRYEVDAWDAFYGAPTVIASGGNAAKGLVPINGSGSGVTSLSDTQTMKAPNAAYAGVITSPPFLATTTTGSFRVDGPAFRTSATTGRFRISELAFREVADPTLLTYDEANLTAAAITSPSSFSSPEEQAFVTFLTANRNVRWAIGGGADAASFTIDKFGRLRLTPTPDFETKASYAVTASGQPFNPSLAAATQAITLTITDINDGFVDTFSGTENSDAALRSGWTAVGLANALQVRSNRIYNNTSSGTVRGGMLAPQQGDTIEQRIEWTAPTTSQGATACVQILDENNWIGCRLNSAIPRIVICQGGVEAFQPAVSPYKSVATTDLLTLQRIGNTVTLYLNYVPVTSADVTGIFPTVKRSGIVSNINASTANQTIDNWRNVTASAITPKIALATLTLTNNTLVAGQAYAGTVNGLTGAPNAIVAVDASGLFFMDGFNLRTTAPLGVSGTVYTVSVDESNDNAATPNPKRTTFTITVP